MTAHIRFTALDDEPATLSAKVIGLLRSELGFGGLVMTDALEMRAIAATAGLEGGAVRALAAGADALCLGADLAPEQVEAVEAAIVAAVREGRLPEERLLEAASRVAETAEWAASPRPRRDREAGAVAARRALRVEGDTSLSGEPLVVELRPEATIAAGEAKHGLGGIEVREGEQLPPLDELRRVVIVVRDAHRHAWQRELVPAGTIVVETGLPEWRPPAARGWIATYGAGRANRGAAVELRANRVDARPDGWRVLFRELETCAECGEPCKRGDLPPGEVVYAGDGHSDYCAALAADRVFATGSLARYLDERGVNYEPLTDFRALV